MIHVGVTYIRSGGKPSDEIILECIKFSTPENALFIDE